MSKKHGAYWVIQEDQDTDGVYTDYGVKRLDAVHTVPLHTLEADDEFHKTEQRVESVRFFEPRNK